MDRLTIKNTAKEITEGDYFCAKMIHNDEFVNVNLIESCSDTCTNCGGNCEKCPIQEAFDKLGKYENIHEFFEEQNENHNDITWTTEDIIDVFNTYLFSHKEI